MDQHIKNKKIIKLNMLKKWKNIVVLTRCKSTKVKQHVTSCIKLNTTLNKSKSYPPWHGSSPSPSSDGTVEPPVTPRGCFSVYVGSERQRFVIKTKYASHPLFKMLLDDAVKQYGYSSEGPLVLPCDVTLFRKVLVEMDSDATDVIRAPTCGGYGSYGLLSPSKLLKLNQH